MGIFKFKKKSKSVSLPVDFEQIHKDILEKVSPFTMTSSERVYGLIESVKYISVNNIEGDILECGVWKGGSMLTVAKVLSMHGDINRRLFMYDTFEGMSEPTGEDKSAEEESAAGMLKKEDRENDAAGVWAYSPLDEVKTTMQLSEYKTSLIHYIKGKVEDTIPDTMPSKIALLRLVTDWYESTRHELIHLFPLLVKGGVLIIDDYGFWKGARKAADEYFAENKIQILFNRMDETGRMAIKQ